MKRMITFSENLDISISDIDIVSLILVDDLDSYNPRDHRVYAATSGKLDYSSLTREQLLQLPPYELQNIHDVRILRKLRKEDLTFQQKNEVMQANEENFESKIKDVKAALAKIKKCNKVYVWDTEKNQTFMDSIYKMGGQVTDRDAMNIVRNLHVKDYSYSTRSYLDINWDSLLMIFEYDGSYVFEPSDADGQPVEVNNLNIFIKIDVDKESRRGYAAMSFHSPEFKMKHPYADYPVDKE